MTTVLCIIGFMCLKMVGAILFALWSVRSGKRSSCTSNSPEVLTPHKLSRWRNLIRVSWLRSFAGLLAVSIASSSSAADAVVHVHGSGGGYNGHRERAAIYLNFSVSGAVTDGAYTCKLDQTLTGSATSTNAYSVTVNIAGNTVTSVNFGTGNIPNGSLWRTVDPVNDMPIASGGTITWHAHSIDTSNFSGDYVVQRLDTYTDAQTSDVVTNYTYNITDTGTLITGHATLNGTLHVPKHSKAHTISVKYNGASVASNTSTVNNSVDATTTISFTNNTAHTGDTYEFFVDGFSQGVHTVTLTNTGTTESPNWQFAGSLDVGVTGGDYAAPTPTPAQTPTPTPYPTPTPSGGGTPTPLPPGATPPPTVTVVPPNGSGQTIYSGHVTVDNPADIYKPIVDAINKATDTSDVTVPTFTDVDTTDRGHLDDLQGAADDIKDNVNNLTDEAKDSMTAAVTDNAEVNLWKNASFGSVSTLPVDMSMFASWMPHGNIAIPSYFSTIRSAILWVLYGLWMWFALKAVLSLKVEA